MGEDTILLFSGVSIKGKQDRGVEVGTAESGDGSWVMCRRHDNGFATYFGVELPPEPSGHKIHRIPFQPGPANPLQVVMQVKEDFGDRLAVPKLWYSTPDDGDFILIINSPQEVTIEWHQRKFGPAEAKRIETALNGADCSCLVRHARWPSNLRITFNSQLMHDDYDTLLAAYHRIANLVYNA